MAWLLAHQPMDPAADYSSWLSSLAFSVSVNLISPISRHHPPSISPLDSHRLFFEMEQKNKKLRRFQRRPGTARCVRMESGTSTRNFGFTGTPVNQRASRGP